MGLEVYIKRLFTDDQGTIGVLAVPAFAWSCFVNELPDRDNERCYSRIPEGNYDVNLIYSPKFGDVFYVNPVPGRSEILIHAGNFAGDTKKNWLTHSLGCILIGAKVAIIGKQRGLLNAKSTRDIFQKLLNEESFKLIIS